jgi:hypothetical protein
MATLHIAPNPAAGDGIRTALAETGADDVVLINDDDFSCGPIDPASLPRRQAWWATNYSWLHRQPRIDAATISTERFWARLDTDTEAAPTLWVSKASAQEISFFLYFAARFGDRHWSVIDVTETRSLDAPHHAENAAGQALPEIPDGAKPSRAVAALAPRHLQRLLKTARPVRKTERDELAKHWHTLQAENTPLRVITGTGLTSVSADYFDEPLLEHTPTAPTPMARVLADTMGSQPFPTPDYILHRRLIDMIHRGTIAAQGDPEVMAGCRISSMRQ